MGDKKFYVYIWRNGPDYIANVSDLPTVGSGAVQVKTPDELAQFVDNGHANRVMFCFDYMPRKAQPAAQCKDKGLYRRLFEYKPRQYRG